jgi:hypothetical protein
VGGAAQLARAQAAQEQARAAQAAALAEAQKAQQERGAAAQAAAEAAQAHMDAMRLQGAAEGAACSSIFHRQRGQEGAHRKAIGKGAALRGGEERGGVGRSE